MADILNEIEKLQIFTEAEATEATEKIWKSLLKESPNLSPVKIPEGIITGGTPGAGKSVFVELANTRFKDNLLVIDGDQFRRYHPNFAKLQKLVGSDIAFVTGPLLSYFNFPYKLK